MGYVWGTLGVINGRKGVVYGNMGHTLGCNFLYTITADWSKTTRSGGVPNYLYEEDIFIMSLTLTEPIFKNF